MSDDGDYMAWQATRDYDRAMDDLAGADRERESLLARAERAEGLLRRCNTESRKYWSAEVSAFLAAVREGSQQP